LSSPFLFKTEIVHGILKYLGSLACLLFLAMQSIPVYHILFRHQQICAFINQVVALQRKVEGNNLNYKIYSQYSHLLLSYKIPH